MAIFTHTLGTTQLSAALRQRAPRALLMLAALVGMFVLAGPALAGPTLPTITSFSPVHPCPGTWLTVKGTSGLYGFAGVDRAHFGTGATALGAIILGPPVDTTYVFVPTTAHGTSDLWLSRLSWSGPHVQVAISSNCGTHSQWPAPTG